jgi:DNA helicase IV
VSAAPTSEDPEVRAEQEYLDQAHLALAAMRRRAAGLLDDLRGAGNPDLDYQAALVRRVNLLADSPRPLLFGRIDEEAGPSWHIGRRHVEDQRGDPVVVDWRAPVSVSFYQARGTDARGLTRRRQVMVDRRTVVAVADDLFGSDGDQSSTRLRGGDALLAELERARTGEMLDIVATIQAEQDEIIRAPLDQLVAVQGGPGTGKTAVGLHRAAFLLYNHPELSRSGVLVLGPSRAFLRYIAQVLPSLGEEAVIQTTIADLAPRVRVTGEDAFEVGRLKGDARFAEVLARSLRSRRRPLEGPVRLQARSAGCVLTADQVNDLADSIAGHPGPYRAGRAALRARLVSLVRQSLRGSGRLEANEPWLEREVSGSDAFRSMLDRLWPSVSAKALVRELCSSPERLEAPARGVLTESECRLLVSGRTRRSGPAAWARDDLPLLDEAEFLINGRTRSYGHIVIDEAQDLSPMQLRMVARRSPAGSITILGDLAQATGGWAYDEWDSILQHLPSSAPLRRDELTLGYRAPGQVLDFASRLLPLAAPTVTPTRSIRSGSDPPVILRVDPDRLLLEALREAARLADGGQLIGVVMAPDHLALMTAMDPDRATVGLLDRDGIARPVTLVTASGVKGLEFDAVVVVEPAAIAGDDRRGLRMLYVAMTRPIRQLSIVHSEPLPEVLRSE